MQAEAFFENESLEEDDEDEEMRAELQKAFAARDARRKAANEEDADETADADDGSDAESDEGKE